MANPKKRGRNAQSKENEGEKGQKLLPVTILSGFLVSHGDRQCNIEITS